MTYDSIIFDMDGTLWDAVDSYAEIWNSTLREECISRKPVTRADLISLMGHPLPEIARILLPGLSDEEIDRFMATLCRKDLELMPVLGGKLYPGVKDTLERLYKEGVRLFLLSNCGPEDLPMFMRFTGLEQYFTDHLSYGSTGCGKDVNIRKLISRYALRRPLYVGDTTGDLRSTRLAGDTDFAWASWGFGIDFPAAEADHVLRSISDLINL